MLLAALVNLFPQAILELLGTTPADGTLYTAAKGYLCLIASGAPLFLLKYVLNDFCAAMTTGGWQRAVRCMATPSALRWILYLCRVWGWARPAPPVLP